MKPSSYYSSEGDIVYIGVRAPRGPVCTEHDEKGLRDYDAETGELIGVELWNASTTLPAELIEILPRLDGRRTVLDQSPGAQRQTA